MTSQDLASSPERRTYEYQPYRSGNSYYQGSHAGERSAGKSYY